MVRQSDLVHVICMRDEGVEQQLVQSQTVTSHQVTKQLVAHSDSI